MGTDFETEVESGEPFCPVAGYATAIMMDTYVALRIAFVRSMQDIDAGRLAAEQFSLRADQALELAESLRQRALAALQSHNDETQAH